MAPSPPLCRRGWQAITSIGSNPGLFSTIMTDPLAYNTTSAPSAAYVG